MSKMRSAPPSAGQTVRNDTTYTYFDNGWTASATDPYGIRTTYDYNALGQQTTRSVASGGGVATHTVQWSYPAGSAASRA